MARRSLKPELNQIRTWVRQGRTDAWIAHQLKVSVPDIKGFKRDHGLVPEGEEGAEAGGFEHGEPDLRAEDDALVAAALEAEQEAGDEQETADEQQADDDQVEAEAESGEGEEPKPRRRGRRGGRGRRRKRTALEGTFDHGEEGYGLWLDPAVQDDPVYAEHWAGHRPVSVTVEAERIVITRAGDAAQADGAGSDDEE